MNFSSIVVPSCPDGSIVDLRVRQGIWVYKGQILALVKSAKENEADSKDQVSLKIKAEAPGKVVEVLKKNGEEVKAGDVLFKVSSECSHPTLMKNMCAECGADLEKDGISNNGAPASFAVVHSIPELKVSGEEAIVLGKEDEGRLIRTRRLVLLVDLDQTLIHTTNENIPPNMKDVYHFQLYGSRSPWYHTRIRPGTSGFLNRISKFFELHICTFGARLYAHTIANFLDQDSKFFSHRILSRDECFDNRSKTANLSSLFPCGDHMVCIIDDREDVWNFAPNLVHVKPYIFFKNTGDINAPPGLPPKFTPSDQPDIDFKRKPKEETKVETDATSSGSCRQFDRRDSIDMPPLEGDVTELPRDQSDEKNPSGSVEVVGSAETDLALTDDDDDDNTSKNSQSSSDSSDSSSSEESKSEKKPENTEGNLSKNKTAQAEPSKATKDDDLVEVEDNDDYLLYLEDILKTIHKAYYDLLDQMKDQGKTGVPDLKNVIPYVKRKVLQGTSLVFSGIVPTNIPLEKSKAFLVAKSLGAKVMDRVTSETTHLVAAKLGTAKVNDARKRKSIKLVTPDWLWSCAERWEHVDERLYPLYKSAPVTLKPPAHCSSPEIVFAERCPPVPKDTPGPGDSPSRMPETLNPFLAFSSEDLQGMDKEVEDILSNESSSSEDEADASKQESDDSSDDSLTAEFPKGHKRKREEDSDGEKKEDATNVEKFRRGQALPADYDIATRSDDEDEEGDWTKMAAEIEREFLGDGESNSSFAG